MGIVKDELVEVKEQYGDERRTEIQMDAEEFNPEDFYADEDVVITISHLGYIKRTALAEFKTQGRGGTGSKGSSTRDSDFVEHMYVASMHNTMLFFTEKGKCFWLKVYEIPEGTRTSKGRAMQNLLNIETEDSVKAYINVKDLKDEDYINSHNIILATKKGVVKKTLLEAYSRPRTNGIVAVNIREGDELLEAKLTNGKHDILMGVKAGKAIRFPEANVRTVGRTAGGVRGISLAEGDEVIGMITVENESEDILVVSENGYGKRSLIKDYRVINRGGKGVKTMNVTDKTGKMIALKGVTDSDDIMIITRKGLTIRLSVEKMRVLGRATQGVRLINLKKDDQIAAIAYAANNGDEEEIEEVVEEVVDNTPEDLSEGQE
jgi:DNA gyrase subunit A